jgi:hypothetical protein
MALDWAKEEKPWEGGAVFCSESGGIIMHGGKGINNWEASMWKNI